MKTVLIVDDEALFLASLVEGLERYANEFSVVTAENGRAAGEVLESRTVDLVVTDLKMPVMDGFQLLAFMSRHYPLVPAIVMTAFGTPSIEDQIRALDAVDYLEKPIDFQTLLDRIRTGLERLSRGHIRGITLFSFLQLLNLEQKTCCVGVACGGREGFLYFVKGELVDARLGDIDGERAAHEIVCWNDAEIEIVELFRQVHRKIETPLANLLMDAAQLQDEAGRDGPDSAEFLDTQNLRPIGEENIMAGNVSQSLESLMQIDGAMAAALVDAKSGMALGTVGSGMNLDVAAAGNSEVIRSKMKVMQNLGLKDKIEDILISLGSQYHLIRPLTNAPSLFFYLVLNRTQANLALARHKLSDVEAQVEV